MAYTAVCSYCNGYLTALGECVTPGCPKNAHNSWDICVICGCRLSHGYCTNTNCPKKQMGSIVTKDATVEDKILQKLDTIINLLQQRKDI